jgi:Ca2+-binding RTX toxin-like protein
MAGYYGTDIDNLQIGGAFTEYYGGNGNDYLIGNTGQNNDFFGGYGNDILLAEAPGSAFTGTGTFANPYVLTYVGATSLDNYLYGDEDSDIMYGFAGNDVFYGGAGDDSGIVLAFSSFYWQAGLYGGAGADYLDGGQGNDKLDGGTDADYMTGGTGNDDMYGGGDVASDTMYGGDGNDLMDGGSGQDFMFGGNDEDKLYASLGNDYAYGEGGNDFIFGDVGEDLVAGGTGNDDVRGGDGIDSVLGGAGNDYYFGGAGADYLYMMDGGITTNETDFVLDFQDTAFGAATNDYIVLNKAVANDMTIFAASGYTWIAVATATGYHYNAFSGTSVAAISDNIYYI